MKRQDTEKIISEYVKPVFGFALKRCKNVQDAEDLSQEIILRAFNTLLHRDDISDVRKYIWTVAHNALSNYYREASKSIVGIPLCEIEEYVADDTEDNADTRSSLAKLQQEIAYLSKLQRRIVIAYYFENLKQAEIADELGIPIGTVKWHLFEAKKELKRGIDTVRKTSELKFNPIKFSNVGLNGSCGSSSPDEFFRSPLLQNICYCVRKEAKTVNEIADALGVSPVYVESEVAHLEEYKILEQRGDKYISNIIIHEITSEICTLSDTMYRRAAEIFANELYDELISSNILDDSRIICEQTDGALQNENPQKDKNFLLWTLIPYIGAWSCEKLFDKGIIFDEVTTIRPDGGQNIISAAVTPNKLELPPDYLHMKNWCGPMWNSHDGIMHWQIDSEWTSRVRAPLDNKYEKEIGSVIELYKREQQERLSRDEYAFLAELGYIKTNGDYDGDFKSAWQMVHLDGKEICDKLIAIGARIKEKHKAKLEALREPYMKAALDMVAPHMRRVREYELQFVFSSDGYFLLHCIVCLLDNGKLKLPTEEQRKMLTTLILVNK